MEGCLNEANYITAIDRDFIGVSPLEDSSVNISFSIRNPRGRLCRICRIRQSRDSTGYELRDKIRRLLKEERAY